MHSDFKHIPQLAGLESELVVLHEQQGRVELEPAFDAMEGWKIALEKARLHGYV